MPAFRRRRRIALEAPDGQVVVRDLSRAGARLVELQLPDGRTVLVSEHLCGWAATRRPADGDVLWPTVADAVEALTGRTRDGEPWISVLEEFATGLSAPHNAPMLADEERRIADIRRRAPAAYVDGPRAHNSGGWYMFVGGLPGGEWVMEYGDTPIEAARAALERVEGLLPEE